MNHNGFAVNHLNNLALFDPFQQPLPRALFQGLAPPRPPELHQVFVILVLRLIESFAFPVKGVTQAPDSHFKQRGDEKRNNDQQHAEKGSQALRRFSFKHSVFNFQGLQRGGA